MSIAIQILKNPDGQIAFQAAELLGAMAAEPALAVPALLESVQGADTLVATTALRSLTNFPEEAEAIVPVLTNVIHHTNSTIRHYARDALKRIDPVVAANAGVP